MKLKLFFNAGPVNDNFAWNHRSSDVCVCDTHKDTQRQTQAHTHKIILYIILTGDVYSSVVRESEFKSEDSEFDPLAG